MTQSTRGIVLRYYPYSESSIIVKIFTENFGLQSYIVKGIRARKSKTKIAIFQPLTLLEFVAYRKENKSIHHLKEPRVPFHFQSIPVDLHKRSIQFFWPNYYTKQFAKKFRICLYSDGYTTQLHGSTSVRKAH